MTRRTFRTAAVVLAAFGTLSATPGCAVLLTGYLVGKAISDDKAEKACRENLRITNEARIAKGQEPFPDQCSR